jgi:hypothetical protein
MSTLKSETEFLKTLHGLIAQAGDDVVYIRYEFPGGDLFIIGFQSVVNEETRRIFIPLQLKSPSDQTDSLFEFYMPDEDDSHYRSFEDETGDLFLEVRFPHCTRHHSVEQTQHARLQFATKQTLLDPEESSPVVH